MTGTRGRPRKTRLAPRVEMHYLEDFQCLLKEIEFECLIRQLELHGKWDLRGSRHGRWRKPAALAEAPSAQARAAVRSTRLREAQTVPRSRGTPSRCYSGLGRGDGSPRNWKGTNNYILR